MSKKASVFLKEERERKANIFHNNEVLPWKVNELQFYNYIMENLMTLINKLASLAGEIDMNLPATFFPYVRNMTFAKI